MKNILFSLLLVTGMVQAAEPHEAGAYDSLEIEEYMPHPMTCAMPNIRIKIAGLDKKELLRRLFKRAKHQEQGAIQHTDDLTDQELEEYAAKGSIGIIHNKQLEISLREEDDWLNVYAYNHFNGVNAAHDVIAGLFQELGATKSAGKQ